MTKSQVLESLQGFFPFITAREVKDLVGSGNLTLEKLKHLLFHPEVPVRFVLSSVQRLVYVLACHALSSVIKALNTRGGRACWLIS